jgi:hypothetical protein
VRLWPARQSAAVTTSTVVKVASITGASLAYAAGEAQAAALFVADRLGSDDAFGNGLGVTLRAG